MGEAKKKSRSRQLILANEPRCIYCAEPPESVEHMPPIGMFKTRFRPSGMEFASCSGCNTGTRGADIVASFLARISPFDDADTWRIKEATKLKPALEKFAPGVLKELFHEQKKQIIWTRNPKGVRVRSVMRIADGPLVKAYLTVFGAKLAMALYREHTGIALPLTGGVQTTMFLNAGLAQAKADAILKITPLFSTLTQGDAHVPDQFAYRYNTDGESVLLAIIGFHRGLYIVVFATSMPEFYRFVVNPLFREPYIKPGGIRAMMPITVSPNPSATLSMSV
jgi:hypothetical protein